MLLTGAKIRLNLDPMITSDLRRVWTDTRKHLVEPALNRQMELEDFASCCLAFATIEHTGPRNTTSAPNKASSIASTSQQGSSFRAIRSSIPAKPIIMSQSSATRGIAYFDDEFGEDDDACWIMEPIKPTKVVAFKPEGLRNETGNEIIGVIYLHETDSALSGAEAALGIGLLPSWRGRDLGTEAVDFLLDWAFKELTVGGVPLQRVVARVAHCAEDHTWIRAASFFEELTFEQESYSSQTFRCCSTEWIDVSVYVVLDMHWSIKDGARKMRELRKQRETWMAGVVTCRKRPRTEVIIDANHLQKRRRKCVGLSDL